jgi:pimeloyl-ACP methyl ester carboxylesterase
MRRNCHAGKGLGKSRRSFEKTKIKGFGKLQIVAALRENGTGTLAGTEKQTMKKWPWVAALTALAGVAVTAKLVRRPRDVEWSDYAGQLPHTEHSAFVAVDGVRLHFQDFGPRHAPAVILIHGFGSSCYIWADTVQLLADAGFRVIAPDLVGFGFSEKPPYAEYTIHFQARMILRLMNRLGIGRAQLAGSSYGGAVAVTCALEAPERVEKLVLAGPVSSDYVTSQGLARLAAAPLAGDLLTPLLLDSKTLVRWRMRQVYAPRNAHLLDDPRRLALRQILLGNANAHRAVLASLRRWDANHVSRASYSVSDTSALGRPGPGCAVDGRATPFPHYPRLAPCGLPRVRPRPARRIPRTFCPSGRPIFARHTALYPYRRGSRRQQVAQFGRR